MAQELSQGRIAISSQATSCQVGGETVILDVGSGQYFALDPIGSAIWNHLQLPCSLEVLCERLLAEYDVSADQCKSQVAALVEELARHGLVRFTP